MKDSKIEVLNNKIYVNCYTLQRFISEIKKLAPNMTPQQCFDLVTDVTKAAKNFKQHDNESEKIKMVLGKIKNNEYFITGNHFPYHYTYWWAGNSIHQTSNTSFPSAKNQRIDLPISAITKPNSIQPGTVVTKNTQFVEKQTWLWVPAYQIAVIKSNNLDCFDLSATESEIINQRREIFQSLFNTHLNVNLPNNASILQHLQIGSYTINLEVLSYEEVIKIIDNIV